MPDTDVEAYARYRLLDDAPNLTRPLLLIHGLADDNVYVANTLRLSKALLEAGRLHSVIPLSGITHAPSRPEVAENLLLLQVRFLRQALGLPDPDAADRALSPLLGWPRPRTEASPACPSSCRNTAERRSGRPSGSRPSPIAWSAPRRTATRSSWPSPPWATPPTTCSRWRSRSRSSPSLASWTCCSPPASGSRCRCSRSRSTRGAARPPHTPVRRPASSRTRNTARRGSSRSDPQRILESLGEGNVVIVAGLPRALDELRHHHARPRWVRHDRRGHGGGGRRRGLRDLHRRRRRLHRRPQDRTRRAEGADDLLRRDARALGRGRQGPELAVGGVRSAARRDHPRAVVVRGRAGHVGAGGGRAADGRRADLGGGARQRRGQGHAGSRPRPAGRGRDRVPRHRRRGHQRRHDRAERVARRRHRPVVHRSARRDPAPRAGDGAGREGDRRHAILDRRRDLQGVARRRGDEVASGRGGRPLRRAGRGRASTSR